MRVNVNVVFWCFIANAQVGKVTFKLECKTWARMKAHHDDLFSNFTPKRSGSLLFLHLVFLKNTQK